MKQKMLVSVVDAVNEKIERLKDERGSLVSHLDSMRVELTKASELLVSLNTQIKELEDYLKRGNDE